MKFFPHFKHKTKVLFECTVFIKSQTACIDIFSSFINKVLSVVSYTYVMTINHPILHFLHKLVSTTTKSCKR